MKIFEEEEKVIINWFYETKELLKKINLKRIENNLDEITENELKNNMQVFQTLSKYIPILERTVISVYNSNKRKMELTFTIKKDKKTEEEFQEILTDFTNFILDKTMSKDFSIKYYDIDYYFQCLDIRKSVTLLEESLDNKEIKSKKNKV